MKTINLQKLAGSIQARINCINSNNTEWKEKHEDVIMEFEKLLPSGSGLDSGCKFDLEKSNANKIVISTSFHHLNEGGYYDGWTNHNITLTPTFGGFDIKISGRDRNMIKDYLCDTFSEYFTANYTLGN